MWNGLRVGVGIPAYRAGAHVREVLRRIPDYVDLVVVVDDASGDATESEIRAAMSVDRRIAIIVHERNQGVGGATLTAFRRLADLGADVLVKLDSDGQMDPAEIALLLAPIAERACGYAKGNRFHDRVALRRMPPLRVAGNFALTFATKAASGCWNVADPQNGFVAVHAGVFNRVPSEDIARGWFFENDMLVHMNILDVPVQDVPLPARYGTEQSSLRISRVLFTFPILLFHRYWRRIWRRHVLFDSSPIAVLLFLGLPIVLWGVAFGAFAWARSVQTGVPATTGTVMLSVLPLILGFQMLLQALLLDIQSTPRGEQPRGVRAVDPKGP